MISLLFRECYFSQQLPGKKVIIREEYHVPGLGCVPRMFSIFLGHNNVPRYCRVPKQYISFVKVFPSPNIAKTKIQFLLKLDSKENCATIKQEEKQERILYVIKSSLPILVGKKMEKTFETFNLPYMNYTV